MCQRSQNPPIKEAVELEKMRQNVESALEVTEEMSAKGQGEQALAFSI
jgi:hypothetical protein